MSLEYSQLWEGDSVTYLPITGKAKTATMHYLVTGTASESEALSYLAGQLRSKDNVYDPANATLAGVTTAWMEPQTLTVQERLSLNEWKIDAEFKLVNIWQASKKKQTLPTEVVTYSNQGQMQHVTHSQATVHSYANTGCTAPNFNGAVGVNAAGDVDGCDIYVGNPTMTITHCFTKKEFTTALRNRILLASRWVNSDEFRGFDRGELLFVGSNISWIEGDELSYWQVEYSFAISPNDSSVEVAGWSGNDIEKKGWEYLWIYDQVGNQVTPHPDAAYVERFYKYRDFTQLGLKKNG